MKDHVNYINESDVSMPELLTQIEAAALLKKPPRWLERKRWEGGGPDFRYIGRSPRYEKQALIRWYMNLPQQSNTSIQR